MKEKQCANCGKWIQVRIKLPKKCTFCKEKFEEAAPSKKPLSLEKCTV